MSVDSDADQMYHGLLYFFVSEGNNEFDGMRILKIWISHQQHDYHLVINMPAVLP
jgi:hypothetical protein